MKKYPDLTSLGYRIDCELGQNRKGGRITWKGSCLNNHKTVIIKQFCFTVENSSWSGYEAYEQEIKILKDLEHSRIPSYLDSVETKDSFFLIQEYINADNLYNFSSLTLTEIKQVALQLLDILVYLQNRNTPILHRDIKPKNILLDKNLKAYLIDFSLASFYDQELVSNSLFQGTSGFMAPEQITKSTLSSDLYSLGMTLVCLLADQEISTVCTFSTADNPYQLELKKLLPSLEQSFFDWLDLMTQAQVSKRFSDATTARNELLFFDPQIELSQLENNNSQVDVQVTMPKVLGTIGIIVISAISSMSISFVEHQIKLTFTTIAIAIVAVVAISITQLGAISIAKLDPQSKLLGLSISTVLPAMLVLVSSLIWGIEEAVVIVAAMTIAEIFILAGFWWQIPGWLAQSALIKFGSLVGAIALGVSLGLNLA